MSSYTLQVVVTVLVYTVFTLLFRLKLKTKWIWSFLAGACASFIISSIVFHSADTVTKDNTQAQNQTNTSQTTQQNTQNQTASTSQDKQPSSNIGTKFQYGASLKDVEQELGKPIKQVKDFYGLYLVKFKTESYLLNKQDNVAGMLITSPSISIYGANIEMTETEIQSHLGKPVEAKWDTTGSTKMYITTYKHGGSTIHFASAQKNGKIEYAVVLED